MFYENYAIEMLIDERTIFLKTKSCAP